MTHPGLEFAVASNDIDASRQLAESLAGTLYCDEREQWQHLPFRALTTLVTDDLDSLRGAADVGLYLVARRIIKPGPPSLIGLFPLIHHPQLTHQAADAHWRDTHAPLALEHHGYMTYYSQLSVVHKFSGVEVDGFALCGFKDVGDLRERFYSTTDGPGVIARDVANFADTSASPRRLIVRETRFGN